MEKLNLKMYFTIKQMDICVILFPHLHSTINTIYFILFLIIGSHRFQAQHFVFCYAPSS